MPFASSTLGAEQPLLASELLGFGRDPLAPVQDAVTGDGDVVVPIDAEAWGAWLKAAPRGEPTTAGTGPYTHEYRSGSWTLPSMSIETGMPEVPSFGLCSGVVLDQLSWRMQRGGLLTATARLVAQGETVAAVSAVGAPADWTLARFGQFNGSVTRNAAALGNIVSAEVTYANNLDRIETIRSGGRIAGADPSVAAITGRIASAKLEFAFVCPSGERFSVTVFFCQPAVEAISSMLPLSEHRASRSASPVWCRRGPCAPTVSSRSVSGVSRAAA